MRLNRARLTPARRRRNREALREVLGVPDEGTLADPPGDPHRDDRGGLGFLEVGSELLELDHDDLTALTADVSPRRRRPRPPNPSRVSPRTTASAIEAGLITEEEARKASEHASGDRGGSGVREASVSRGRVSEQRRAVERLSASAERVCGCSDGGPDAAEDRKCGCGGICRMAERHGRRFERAGGGGLGESEEAAGLRDWAGDLAA